jgi:beta-glucanase (GH16 family)
MKKIWPFTFIIFTVTACVNPSVSPSSSSGVPNGRLPLTAVEGCGVQTIDNQWVCTWTDEFNGDALLTDHWNVEVNGDGGGNQEAQYYRSENISVSDGTLKITAKRENYLGKQYTSGRINSRYKVNPQFGRVTFRAKMPAGRGTWAAVWMLPLFNRFGQWPNSGEIDILEYVGYDPGTVFSATHTTKFNHTKNNNPSASRVLVDPENQFYEYEMIWLPGEIRMFVEGNPYGTYRYVPQFNQDVPHDDVFPFQEEFYFIINLAVGGSWGGVQGIDPLAFPTVFELDYLRLYEWDYARYDLTNPEKPTALATSQLDNTIHWNRPTDDTWVSHYEIYLDGVKYRQAKINQFTFVGLEARDYQVQVEAVDFVGRTSPLSDAITFSFGG